MKSTPLKELQTIPGIGKSIAADLVNIGILKVSQLKNRNPERLYERISKHYGYRQDICLLYVLRCAVYFATSKKHDPHKLKWWYWKE